MMQGYGNNIAKGLRAMFFIALIGGILLGGGITYGILLAISYDKVHNDMKK